MKLPWLDPAYMDFPCTSQALPEPNGLLAAGGQLSPEWLLGAYKRGIFPWFNDGDPILWWSPSPRMVLYPYQFHISRSLRKVLKKVDYEVTINRDFENVISCCSDSGYRKPVTDGTSGTWITDDMIQAYIQLHQHGFAHSVEVWRDRQLIGGLYGIAIGKVFFGESMFSRETNGSKIALSHLVEWLKQWHYKLIDCQVTNDHLHSLGAIEIDRHTFEQALQRYAVLGTVVQTPSSADLQGKWFQEEWRPQPICFPATVWEGQNKH